MIGKLELIGEWAEDGSLQDRGERRILNVKELNETIKKKVYEIDLELLLAGLITILGCHVENGNKRYYIELHVPLVPEDNGEYDLNILERRASALKELKERGYYLEGLRAGSVLCYKEGALAELEDELDLIEGAIVGAG